MEGQTEKEQEKTNNKLVDSNPNRAILRVNGSGLWNSVKRQRLSERTE